MQPVEWKFMARKHGYVYMLPHDHLRIRIADELLLTRKWWHTIQWLYCTLRGHVYDPELQVCKGYFKHHGFFVGQLCPACLHLVFGHPLKEMKT